MNSYSAFDPLMVGDTGSGDIGEIPGSSSGNAAAGKYLCADGTWSVPGGGSGVFSSGNDLVFNLDGSRLVSSTVLKLLNAGRYAEDGQQLLLWDHAGGRKISALRHYRHLPEASVVSATV
jgi:hypothetical protein